VIKSGAGRRNPTIFTGAATDAISVSAVLRPVIGSSLASSKPHTPWTIRRVSPLRAFPSDHFPIADEPSAPELEVDQTIAPSPEAEIVLRAKSDIEDHSAHRVKSLRCWSRNDQDEIAFPSSWVLTRPAHA
jgi:hypothetical protein